MNKPKVFIDWNGPGGNVFSLVATVKSTLDDYGMRDEARKVKKEFVEMAMKGRTYEDIYYGISKKDAEEYGYQQLAYGNIADFYTKKLPIMKARNWVLWATIEPNDS